MLTGLLAMKTWNDFVKVSGVIGADGRTFMLPKGKTLSHVVSEWNNANRNRRISVNDIVAANSGLDARKYVAGRKYNMPVKTHTQAAIGVPQARGKFPLANNNPGNMRFYNIGWLGELRNGLKNGDFTKFDTPQHGLRAMARNLMNIGKRQKAFTIDSITPIYSPPNENNVKRHASNISSISGLSGNKVLDPNNNKHMTSLLKGFLGAESGNKVMNWFTEKELLDAVRAARTSVKTK